MVKLGNEYHTATSVYHNVTNAYRVTVYTFRYSKNPFKEFYANLFKSLLLQSDNTATFIQ